MRPCCLISTVAEKSKRNRRSDVSETTISVDPVFRKVGKTSKQFSKNSFSLSCQKSLKVIRKMKQTCSEQRMTRCTRSADDTCRAERLATRRPRARGKRCLQGSSRNPNWKVWPRAETHAILNKRHGFYARQGEAHESLVEYSGTWRQVGGCCRFAA